MKYYTIENNHMHLIKFFNSKKAIKNYYYNSLVDLDKNNFVYALNKLSKGNASFTGHRFNGSMLELQIKQINFIN